MTLKHRIRKALFAFFKEEILEAVKAKDIPPRFEPKSVVNIHQKDLNFKELICELNFNDTEYSQRYGEQHIPMILEREIDKAKKMMFEEMIKFIRIDSEEMFDERFYRRRRFRFSLWVGKLKWS